MQTLHTTCQQWLKSGHRLKEFVDQTALDPGYCSYLFNGKRVPNLDTLGLIIARLEEPEFATRFLRAWIVDHIARLPEPWNHRLTVHIVEDAEKLQEPDPNATSQSKARAWCLKAIDSDPKFFETILNLWELLGCPEV